YHPHPHSFPTRRSSDLLGRHLIFCSVLRRRPGLVGRKHLFRAAKGALQCSTEEVFGMGPRQFRQVGGGVLKRDRVHDGGSIKLRSEEHTSELQSRENLV